MSNAYGRITVGGDYRGDIGSLVRCLNKLKFHGDADADLDSIQFIAADGKVCPKGMEAVIDPRLPPDRVTINFRDGRSVFLDEATDSLINEWKDEDSYDLDCEECDLETLSGMISPWLTEGEIELGAFSLLKLEIIHYERLVIRSDGSVEYLCHSSHGDTGSTTDSYTPDVHSAKHSDGCSGLSSYLD